MSEIPRIVPARVACSLCGAMGVDPIDETTPTPWSESILPGCVHFAEPMIPITFNRKTIGEAVRRERIPYASTATKRP